MPYAYGKQTPITAELLKQHGFGVKEYENLYTGQVSKVLADIEIDRKLKYTLFLRIDLTDNNRVSICECRLDFDPNDIEASHERILSKTVLQTLGQLQRLCDVLGVELKKTDK